MTDNKYLPTPYQQEGSIHYVYLHTDPRSKEVMYVGSGTKERAWVYSATTRNNPDHLAWCIELQHLGYTPDEWVSIELRTRDKEQVLAWERKLIVDLDPDFNRTNRRWDWCLTLSEEQLAAARKYRAEGYSYKIIAREVGTSTMTIYRALNGRTKGYNE